MYRVIQRIIILLICGIIGVMFIVPFAYVINPKDNSSGEIWEPLYVWQDVISLCFYLPFLFTWVLFLCRPRLLNHIVFKIVLGLTAALVFFISGSSVALGGQDYEPAVGVLLSVFIFPLYILLLIIRGAIHENKTFARLR